MSLKNKKSLLSGILLVVGMLCYILHHIITYSGFDIAWSSIVFTLIGTMALILYSFLFNNVKIGNVLYFAGFGALALLYASFVINRTYFDLYSLSDIAFLLVVVLMIIAKIKTNKGIAITSMVVFCVCTLIQLITTIYDLMTGMEILLVIDIYLIISSVAFFFLWLSIGSKGLSKNSKVEKTNTQIENNLLSLKNLYETGVITEQEYNDKKESILNNF